MKEEPIDVPMPEATESTPAEAPPKDESTPPVVLSETMFESEEAPSSFKDTDAYIKLIKDQLPLPESNLSPDEQAREFYEDLILSTHTATPTIIDMATATDDEKANERERRLNHPDTKYRFVFQKWPRDPEGEWIKQDGPERRGKEASNGSNIWGASLFDFYTVNRSPKVPNLVTLSSGSRIAAWMKAHGETYAPQCLQAAEDEDEPYLIHPTDIGQLIKDGERMVCHQATWHPSTNNSKKGKARAYEAWELPANWPPKSPFSPLAYPHPWPYKPFEKGNVFIRYPTLQQYITPSRLPARLIVHDPGRILHANPRRYEDVTPETKDIKHIYTLKKSTTNTEREKSDDAELKKMEDDRKRIREEFLKDPTTNRELPSGIVIENPDTSGRLGPCMPPFFIVFPFQPERAPIPEAHLYLSPDAALGQGNHSYVSRAELELPRNFLIDEELCMKCVFQDMQDIITEQDKHGGDPKWGTPCGRHVLKVKHKIGITAVLEKDGKEKEYLARPPQETREIVYEGPYRAIETRVKYQDLSQGPYCEHLRKDLIHPLSSKVYVAAKLSINGDRHLANEAENYQAFPRHFFEHWSGYNIVYPLKEPVPVTPLVPQYYGYYVVDRNAALPKNKKKKKKSKKAKINTDVDMAVDSDVKEGKGKEKQSDGEENAEKPADENMEEVTEEATEEREEEEAEDHAEKATAESTSGETTDEPTPTSGRIEYLSPILLMEDCGSMINPEILSVDDKNECAALIYRFHEADWLHNSVAKRNIVRQAGPISAWPLERMINSTKRGGLGTNWSYRLIDFGRSCEGDDRGHAMTNERSTIDNWLWGFGSL